MWYFLNLPQIFLGYFIASDVRISLFDSLRPSDVSNLTIIGSDNGLSPGRCQAIIWTNPGILLIGPLGTNFSEILIEIQTFSFKKMHLKMSAKWRPFCLRLKVLSLFPCLPATIGPVILGYCIARFDYAANQPNQLSLQRGDRVAILSKAGEDRGWWKGRLEHGTVSASILALYVKYLVWLQFL